jgi:glycosyltransferase involved in cell wall biosynthesis
MLPDDTKQDRWNLPVEQGRPRVELSIITPVYNGRRTIERMMASLGNISPEHRASAEAVFIDDGSTDGTGELIKRISSHLAPMEVLLLCQANQGVSAARNEGIKHARGIWILFIDADDELLLDPFPFMNTHLDNTALGFPIIRLREGRVLNRVKPVLITGTNRLDVFTARNPFQPSSLVIKRECIKTNFDPEIPFGEDWLFWCRNPGIFARMAVEEERTSAAIHIHGMNTSADFNKAGIWRERIAHMLLEENVSTMTRKQRNNLKLQAAIGRFQQRIPVKAGVFFSFPCDPLLYAKFLVYAVSSWLGLRATPYNTNEESR